MPNRRDGLASFCSRYGVPVAGASRWRCERQASAAFDGRLWLADAARWRDIERPAWLAANEALSGAGLDGLDAAGLARQLRVTCAHASAGVALYYELVGAWIVAAGVGDADAVDGMQADIAGVALDAPMRVVCDLVAETGRRLASTAVIPDAAAVSALGLEELVSLLIRGRPASVTVHPTAAPPPGFPELTIPRRWLPPATARMARAVTAGVQSGSA